MSLLLYVVRHERRSNLSGDSMVVFFFSKQCNIDVFFGQMNTIATVAIILMKPFLTIFFLFLFHVISYIL